MADQPEITVRKIAAYVPVNLDDDGTPLNLHGERMVEIEPGVWADPLAAAALTALTAGPLPLSDENLITGARLITELNLTEQGSWLMDEETTTRSSSPTGWLRKCASGAATAASTPPSPATTT